MAVLDALGFGKVESSEDRKDRNSRLDRRVWVLPVCKKKSLQGETIMLKLKSSPAWEVTPKLRTNSIVFDFVSVSAMVAEAAAKRRVNL